MDSFSFASDLHGDRQDKSAVRGFLRFVQDFKPKHRWFGGDVWDFRAFRSGASKEDKMHSMAEDYAAGVAFLEAYQPEVITLGNHDQRLWDVVKKDGLSKTGPLVDYAQELIGRFEKFVAKHKITVLPYHKRKGIFSYKGLSLAHGFDGFDAEDMAKVYGDILFGHGHSIVEGTVPGLRPKTGRQVGALCLLDMDYNRNQVRTLKQEHGWAYGAFLNEGKHQVMQARIQDGQVVYADRLKTIKV
jgi:hypothetical protein